MESVETIGHRKLLLCFKSVVVDETWLGKGLVMGLGHWVRTRLGLVVAGNHGGGPPLTSFLVEALLMRVTPAATELVR